MDFTSGGGLGARVSYAGYPQYPAPPSAYPEGRGTAVPYRHPNAPGYAPRPAQYPIPGNGQFVHRLPPLNHNVQCIEDAAQILGGRLRGPQAFPPVFYDPANSEQPVVSSLPGVNPSQSDAPMQPADEKSFERVALPSEMPFGSNVHRQSRPTAGVIKISNVSVSTPRAWSMIVRANLACNRSRTPSPDRRLSISSVGNLALSHRRKALLFT